MLVLIFPSTEMKIFWVCSLIKHHQWLLLWLVGTWTTPGLLDIWGCCTWSFLLILSSASDDFLILMQLSVLSKNKTKQKHPKMKPLQISGDFFTVILTANSISSGLSKYSTLTSVFMETIRALFGFHLPLPWLGYFL